MRAMTELETFLEVVKQGSFSAAGRRLALASSVVADRISALERRLGVRLLLRTTRSQSLTEAGERYYADARRLFDELQLLENRVMDASDAVRGTLRVTAPHPLGQQWIGPFIEHFSVQYPEIAIHLTLNDDYADIVGDGFDVAIRGGPVVDSLLIGHRLFETRRVVVASPAYLARYGTPNRPEALAAHRCIVFNTHGHVYGEWRFRDGDVSRKLRVAGVLASSLSTLPVTWAVAGLGLTQKSWWEVSEYVLTGKLVTVLDAFEPEPVAFYVIRPLSRSQSRKVALFVEGLRAFLADLDGGLTATIA